MHRIHTVDGCGRVPLPVQYSALQGRLAGRIWELRQDKLDSLEATLAAHSFDPVVRYGSFPMECFLLGGFDYTTDPSKGASAHHSRYAFELSMSSSHRRALFEDFARGGIGRNALVIARRDVGSSD